MVKSEGAKQVGVSFPKPSIVLHNVRQRVSAPHLERGQDQTLSRQVLVFVDDIQRVGETRSVSAIGLNRREASRKESEQVTRFGSL